MERLWLYPVGVGRHLTWLRSRRRMYCAEATGCVALGAELVSCCFLPCWSSETCPAMEPSAMISKIVWGTPVPFPKLCLLFPEVNAYNCAWDSSGSFLSRGPSGSNPIPTWRSFRTMSFLIISLWINPPEPFLRAGFYRKDVGSV